MNSLYFFLTFAIFENVPMYKCDDLTTRSSFRILEVDLNFVETKKIL